MYFLSLAYGRRVIERMAGIATRAAAILELPDAALEAHYAGLEHRYYARSWVEERLRVAGLTGVRSSDQAIAGYADGRHRFNAWAGVG